MGFLGALFSLLGVGAGTAAAGAVTTGLFGLGTTLVGQGLAARQRRKANDRAAGAVAQGQKQEQQQFRNGLQSSGSNVGTGDFASNISGLRRFTGFGA